GAFLFLRRSILANANSIILQWLFWLSLNLVFTFSVPGISIYDHVGGVVSGLILGALLVPNFTRRR
ncbi:MAG TPA: rhomboid family intramembrane serine protease, partial [Ktedonobacterales bacterium]|nr:rhomboid family intramembrane serine protease [Ktedonobacterales bacterium]